MIFIWYVVTFGYIQRMRNKYIAPHGRPSYAWSFGAEEKQFFDSIFYTKRNAQSPVNFDTSISNHYWILAFQPTSTNRSVYFNYVFKGLWGVVIGMGVENLSELCCWFFLAAVPIAFFALNARSKLDLFKTFRTLSVWNSILSRMLISVTSNANNRTNSTCSHKNLIP